MHHEEVGQGGSGGDDTEGAGVYEGGEVEMGVGEVMAAAREKSVCV